jgi:hypothetical protein
VAAFASIVEPSNRAAYQLPACSLEIISQISQPASSVFLSQKISQQYFQPAKSAQANRLYTVPAL